MSKTTLKQNINARKIRYGLILNNSEFEKLDVLIKLDLVRATLENANTDMAIEERYSL